MFLAAVGNKHSMLHAACKEFAPTDAQCECINAEIFISDSGWATNGVGAKTNNPCNMRLAGAKSPVRATPYYAKGNGTFSNFSSMQDGTRACVDLYARKYRGKSWDAIANTWAQTNAAVYHDALGACFNRD